MADQGLTVDVCIATFRRESLADTLASLATQLLPEGAALRLIVADNDDAPSAADLVREAGDRLGLAITYLHCPARNISVARNGALEAARAEWVAFIDDDETAAPHWIGALLAEARRSGADVVLGPVRPVYPPSAPDWMRADAVHAILPTTADGRVIQGYTSNALIRRTSPALEGQRFDPALGRSGGEDTEFFDRLLARGARISYAPDALVEEAVPESRQSVGWLARRRFRAGQTHGLLLLRRQPARGRLIGLGSSGSKAAFCALVALLSLPWARRRYFWTLRAALHAGVFARLAGLSEITQYGNVAPGAPRRSSAE